MIQHHFVTLLLCVLLAQAAFAEESFVVESIEISGLTRTKRDVVLNDLQLAEGDQTTEAHIKGGVQRLKNAGLFAKVEYKIQGSGAKRQLKLEMEDRWTTIPIFKLSSGGGVLQLIAGVFDSNIAGRFLEAGAQYERLGETNSGVAWFKNPRLFGQFFTLFLQAWKINRLRTKYEQDTIDPEVKMGFLHTRQKYSLQLSRELHRLVTVGLVYETNDDSFSLDYVDEETREKTEALGSLPPETTTHFTGMTVSLGKLDFDSYLVEGIKTDLSYRRGRLLSDEGRDFEEMTLSMVAAKTLPLDITLAQRIMAGGTNTQTLQYWFYLGGLDRIRGFADNRFAGRYFWLTNSEVRAPVYKSPILVLQTVAFYDAAATGEKREEVDTATGASIGGGLRLIAPKVYRLVARLDFAYPVLKRDEMPISFGVQQFF